MSEYIYGTDGHEGHWLTGEEIVRCRDCKWCMAYSSATYCDRFAHALPTSEPNGFCAWGERRDA